MDAGSPWASRAALFAAAGIVMLAAFFHAVHLGHEIDDPLAGVFLSRTSGGVAGGVAGSRRPVAVGTPA